MDLSYCEQITTPSTNMMMNMDYLSLNDDDLSDTNEYLSYSRQIELLSYATLPLLDDSILACLEQPHDQNEIVHRIEFTQPLSLIKKPALIKKNRKVIQDYFKIIKNKF
jgi:hypothetical protein